jgi:hypothetical protein
MSMLAEQLDSSTVEYQAIFETELSGQLIDCDTFSDLASWRQEFTGEAMARLLENRQKLLNGDANSVPLPIDSLGTTRNLAYIEQSYGHGSLEYQRGYFGLFMDCLRLWSEAESKYAADYCPPIFQPYNALSGRYTSNDICLHQTIENGLSPEGDIEAQEIRLYDYVEERTNEVIGASNLAREQVSVISFKPCPDYAIRNYQADKKGSHDGFVPAIEKFFIQNFKFSEEGRYHEQVALPGIYITHDLIVETLKEIEAMPEDVSPTKLELRAKQFINTSDSPLVSLTSLLDKKASEATGLNIFMGEVVADDHSKDYELVLQQAADRQVAQESKAHEIAQFLIDLNRQGVDGISGNIVTDDYLKELLFKEALEHPEKAAIIFDEDTALGIQQINNSELAGHDSGNLRKQVYKDAPAASYCGAGSCGLEAVSASSPEVRVAHQHGLVGEVIHDTERSCNNCGEKTVYYDQGGSKTCVNAVCQNTEIRRS